MREHIAQWNPTAQLWETAQTDLFSEQQEPYSETWPTSGMTRNGQLLPLPVSEHHTDGSECLLLPTPVAQQSGNPPEVRLRKKPGRTQVTDLAIVVENGLLETGGLLPTPTATDANGARNRTSGRQPDSKHHDGVTLSDALRLLPTPKSTDHKINASPGEVTRHTPALGAIAHYLPAASALLPTPRATRGGSRTETSYAFGGVRDDSNRPQGEVLLPTPSAADSLGGHMNRSGDRSGEMLLGGIGKLLPTPEAKNAHAGPDYARMKRDGSGGHDLVTAVAYDTVSDTAWGPYEGAIRRWESVTRPVPAPTEPSSKGNQRLSPFFDEWLMGWPQGWATELMTSGVVQRRDVLRLCGNGVVPQQAIAAVVELLQRVAESDPAD